MRVDQAPKRRDWIHGNRLSNETTEVVDDRTKPPFLRRVRIRGYKSSLLRRGSGGAHDPCRPECYGQEHFLDALAFLRTVFDDGVNAAFDKHGGMWFFPR